MGEVRQRRCVESYTQLMLGPQTNINLLGLNLLPPTETNPEPSAGLPFGQEVELEFFFFF